MVKRLMRYVIVTLAVFGLSLPTVASAGRYRNIEIEYYSDATYTDQVGYFLQTCHGVVYSGGERTEFALKISDEACNTPD